MVLLQFVFQREVFVFDLLDLLLDLLDIDRSLLERGRPLHVASVDRFLIGQGASPLFPHVRRLPVMLPAFLDLLSVVAPFSLEGLLLPHFQRPLPLAGLLLALFELGLQIGLLGEVEEGDVADALLVQILLAVGEDVGVEVLGGKYVIIGWQDGHEGDVAVEEAGLGVGPVFGEGGVESAVVVVLVGVGQGGLVVVAHVGVLHEGGVVAAQLLLPVLQTAVVAADFFLLLLDPALLLQPLLLLLPPVLLRLPVQLLLQLSPLAFLLHLLVVVELLREQSSVVAALLQLSGLLFVEHYYYVGCPIFPRKASSITNGGWLWVGGGYIYLLLWADTVG